MVVKNETQETPPAVINIVVTSHTWKRLTALKEPGDSFNTVVKRLLDLEAKHNA